MKMGISLQRLMSSGELFSFHDCFSGMLKRATFDNDAESLALKSLLLCDPKPCSNDYNFGELIGHSTWALLAYQWRANLVFLTVAFRHRRRDSLARPGMSTYLPLIELRRLIVEMRDSLPEAQLASWEMDGIIARCQLNGTTHIPWLVRPTLSQTLVHILEDLNRLDEQLNDEIHLIIGAVTVQDSDANKQQSERATLLTLLAAVYLPLTLVTGIFGMNIKDIDEGKPSWRACGEVLAVVAACTIMFVFAYRRWRIWRREQQERERKRFGFDKDV